MLSDKCISREKTSATKKQSALKRVFREKLQYSSICICTKDVFDIDLPNQRAAAGCTEAGT